MRTAAITTRLLKGLMPVILVAAFLYNIFGYYVVFQVNRTKVRSEMKQQLASAKKKICVLSIFDAEKDPSFHRIHAKEFLYKGQMFDVLRESKNGRTTTFYCLRDVKEELLMAGLRKSAKSKEAQQLVQHLITLAMPSVCVQEPANSNGYIFHPPVKDPLADRPHAPSSPPPEVG
jgi:hypothetical protein